MNDSKLLVIAGPTASGKTGHALARAQEHNGAVISADSRMVYRGLDIGTGKPTWEHRQLAQTPWLKPHPSIVGPIYTIQGIDHYLLDVVEPETPFSLSDWLNLARVAISNIRGRGKRPILAGGTGLYLKALLEGYQPPPTDPTVRSTIKLLSTPVILTELSTVDPETARREQHNRRRLVRALEVYRITGTPISAPRRTDGYQADIEVLLPPREQLFAQIDERISARLAQGMIQEVEELGQRVSRSWLISLGLEYRIITEWLDGQRQENELQTQLQREIHAYARRQETYLRTQLIRQ